MVANGENIRFGQSQELLCNDSQSVSQLSFAMIPYGSHDQILVAVKKIAFLFVVERSLCREGESVI